MLASCGEKIIFNHKADIPSTWAYQDTVVFVFEVSDTIPAYDIKLNVTHADDFAYSNMYVHISTTFPDGQKVENPLSLQLADNRGIWQGKCSGGDCKVPLMLSEKIFFNQPGTYSIKINQHSRTDLITGIKELELSVMENRSKK